MTVYLFTLDDHLAEDISVIVGMFNQNKGLLKFKILSYKSSTEYYSLYHKSKSLTLESISEICNKLKGENNVFEDYGVLVTSKNIEKPKAITLEGKESWYSAFEYKNIAINSNDWNEITEDRSYLAIAHQVIENLFQSLSQMNLGSTQLLEEIHVNSRGCINDYCRNRSEIYAKILSGFICKNCQERFIEKKNNESILSQIKKILSTINKRLTDNYDVNTSEIITVNKYGDIKYGESKLDFGRAKTLPHIYLFYLINHNKPIGENDFWENAEIQKKFVDLSKLTGEFAKPFQMNTYLQNMSAYHAKSKKYIENSIITESLATSLFFKSKKNKDGHHYWLDIDPNNIRLEDSLLQYRIS